MKTLRNGMILMAAIPVWIAAQDEKAPAAKEIISTESGTWRSATVFTHVIWRDMMFFGGGSGSGGGDPRHEMEIGVFHLDTPDSGRHDARNPIVTRKQFGLDRPGRGITPLSIVEIGDRLFMFCTARPGEDLQPRIVVIEASVDDPCSWKNLTVVIDRDFSGHANNHGASALIDPRDPEQLLVYFAALTPPAEYRILLASVPVAKIMDPDAYRLVRDFDDPVLRRANAKANYPFVQYLPDRGEFELWYSGHSIGDSRTRSSFVTRSKDPERFEPARVAVVTPSGIDGRNDFAYATGPKVWRGHVYYSGRAMANGDYRGIFCRPIP